MSEESSSSRASGRRAKKLAENVSRLGFQIHTKSQATPSITHTTIIAGSKITRTTSLPLPPPALPFGSGPTNPSLLHEEPIVPAPLSNNAEMKKPTRLSEAAQDFENGKEWIHTLILSRYSDPQIGELCPCGNSKRSTRCYDCTFSEPTCSECFIIGHQRNPTHWAEVWDFEHGFFIRKDISKLREGGHAVYLGHNGQPCPKRGDVKSKPNYFILTDVNGIHETCVHFCVCTFDNRTTQLFKAGIFPSTLKEPRSGFTFKLLRFFHKQHFEGKTSSYDFIGGLRRETDNAFPHLVPDVYPQFLLVIRMWRVLTCEKRLGQVHGIDSILKHRQPGNLIVHCPSCPEPGVNMEKDWDSTPPEFCHLHQIQLTADGNHHLNKFMKNTDPDDVSLFRGRSYFPDDQQFREYLKSVPARGSEKTTCKHLNALNNQDRKKFRNMDCTGVVQIQCGHVFIKSTVDLQLGERFANTDYALAHALRQNRNLDGSDVYKTSSDAIFSYDIACAYSIHAVERFRTSFPDLIDRVDRQRYIIPVVHVQNHKDNCMYVFSPAYLKHLGRFTGETAEMVWAIFNQLGTQTRQMNNGHRQDTVIDHQNDWNFKKTANMSKMLFNEITYAQTMFKESRDALMSLTGLYAHRVPDWNKKDRAKRHVGDDKEVQCVYRQNQTKVPSQARIYQALMEELDEADKKHARTESAKSPLAAFLNEGLEISSAQRKILFRIKQTKSDDTSAIIKRQREDLRHRIDKWRRHQETMTPQVVDHVKDYILSHATILDTPELETLFLPSDFDSTQRTDLELVTLASYQDRLLEGTACDLIQHIRTLAKVRSGLAHSKKTHARGQAQQTRATAKLQKADELISQSIDNYNAVRKSLLFLRPAAKQYHPLTIQDTFRRPTNKKRAVGDSKQPEGQIWYSSGITGGIRRREAVGPSGQTVAHPPTIVGTQGVRGEKRKSYPNRSGGRKGKKRKHHKHVEGSPEVSQSEKSFEDGWIWSFSPGQLSDHELQDWIDEGDSVHWFRTEAEFQRWQEQVEIKQAEFLRAIRAFRKTSGVWDMLAASGTSPGAVAYAKKKAVMFSEMALSAVTDFSAAGYGDRLRQVEDGAKLWELCAADRLLAENVVDYGEMEVSEAEFHDEGPSRSDDNDDDAIDEADEDATDDDPDLVES